MTRSEVHVTVSTTDGCVGQRYVEGEAPGQVITACRNNPLGDLQAALLLRVVVLERDGGVVLAGHDGDLAVGGHGARVQGVVVDLGVLGVLGDGPHGAGRELVGGDLVGLAVGDLDPGLPVDDVASGVEPLGAVGDGELVLLGRGAARRAGDGLGDLQAALGVYAVRKDDSLVALGQLARMGRARLSLVADNFAFIVIDVVVHRSCVFFAVSIREDLFDLVLGALLKAPEHLLFSVLELELNHTVLKLVVTVLLVVVGVNSTVVVEDGDPKREVLVQVGRIVALDLLFDD